MPSRSRNAVFSRPRSAARALMSTDHRPGVRGLAFARGHAVRDGPPDARQVLDPVTFVNGHAFGLRFREGLSFFPWPWKGVIFALLLFFYEVLDILPGYPSPRTRARDLRYLHVVFLGQAPDDGRGARKAKRLCVFELSATVAIAPRRKSPVSLFSRNGLGFCARGRELFCGSGIGDVLPRWGVCGRRVIIGGDKGYLGADVYRR